MTIAGTCLCGEVRYEINGPLLEADHCHCSLCRRQHGAAFSTYAGFDPRHFTWVRGERLVKVYETKSGGGWCFCGKCGSTLAGTERGRITNITMATIDGDPGIIPEAHIFVGSKARWHTISDELPQFEKRATAHSESISD